MVLACLPLITLWIVFARAFDRGEDYQEYKDQIVITESQSVFGETKSGGATVGVIGTIRNNSVVPWEDIRFHVDFFDSNGKRVDVAQKEQYQFYLAPKEAASFKISFSREYPESNYVKHSIRVATAKDARTKW